MSDPTLPPTPPEPTPGFGAPMPPPPMAYAPAPSNGTPVLGIVALVLSVILPPIGLVLGIITLATAKGRKAAKVLGWISVSVGLVITAGIVAIIIWAVNSVQGAEHVSNDFVNDLQRGDVHAAFALTSTQFQANTSESQLQGVLAQANGSLSGPHHMVSTHIEDSTSVGTFTDFVYQIDGSPSSYLEVELVKQGGDWRVLGFRQSADEPSGTGF